MLRIHYQLLSQKLFYCYVAHCSDRIRSPSFLMPSITNGHRMHPPFFMIACCLPRHETFLQISLVDISSLCAALALCWWFRSFLPSPSSTSNQQCDPWQGGSTRRTNFSPHPLKPSVGCHLYSHSWRILSQFVERIVVRFYVAECLGNWERDSSRAWIVCLL